MEMKADIIALIDDDNIPLPGWGENLLVGRDVEVNYYETDLPVFDPIGATNYPELWHRGYPLQLLPKRDYSRKSRKTVHVDIQADFWNGDPDIDAICRLEHAPECTFKDDVFPFAANKISPFDSQNTFITADVLKQYAMFPHVGRMDDIWPGYYVQAKGFKVVYNKASVYQERNVHDLTVDMRKEYIGYENNLQMLQDMARDPEAYQSYVPGRTVRSFDLYRKHFK
jgi:hypothetical protein